MHANQLKVIEYVVQFRNTYMYVQDMKYEESKPSLRHDPLFSVDCKL